MPPATKRKAGSTLVSSERKRAQNRISQQCLREKNNTYIRNLEETIDILQKVAAGTDTQIENNRYSVLLEAHLKLIAENHKLEEALLRLRKKLLSFSQSAAAAAEDEVFDSVLRRRDTDDSDGAQARHPESSTELLIDESASILDTLNNPQSFPIIHEHVDCQVNMFDDPSFSLGISTNLNNTSDHETLKIMESSTLRPEHSFLNNTMTSGMIQTSPRSLVFVPDQFSITSMSVFGSKLLDACRRHLDKVHAFGNSTDMAERIVKTAVRFSMRCAGLESYAYGVNGARYIERVMSWRLGIGPKDTVPIPFRPTPLQSRNPMHFWGIDLFNWPEIRDQLVLEEESTDVDEILRDLVLHSVIEPVNHQVAVNVLDVYDNQILNRAKTGQHDQSRPKSYFTDPSWTLFQIGPEHGEWYSSGRDVVEEAIFQELDKQISALPTAEESRTNDVAEFLGLNDLCVWKLSKDFAKKYPKLDCSTAVTQRDVAPSATVYCW